MAGEQHRHDISDRAWEKIRQWAVHKGAQHQDTFGHGCAWYAGAILYHFWYHSGLHNCSAVD